MGDELQTHVIENGTNSKANIEVADDDVCLMLNTLLTEEPLIRYRRILQKVNKYVSNMVHNEKTLLRKYKYFQSVIKENQSKLEDAQKVDQVDSCLIDSLKRELKKVWQTVNKVRESESKINEEKCCIEKKLQEFQAMQSEETNKEKLQEYQEMKRENKCLNAKIIQYEDKLTYLTTAPEEIINLKKQLARKSKSIASLREKLDSQSKQNEKTEDPNNECKIEEVAKNRDKMELHSQLATNFEVSQKIEELRYQEKRLEAHGKFLYYENLIAKLKNENQKISNDLMKTESIIKEQKEELSNLKSMCNDLLEKFNTKVSDDETKRLKERNILLKIEYGKLKEKLKHTMAEFNQIKDAYDKSPHNILASKNYIEEVKNEDNALKMEVEVLDDHMTHIKSEVEKYRLLIRQMENIRDKDIVERTKQEDIICTLKLKLTSMEIINYPQKIEDLKAALVEKQAALENVEKNFEESEIKLKNDIYALDTMLCTTKNEILRLQQIINQKELILFDYASKLQILEKKYRTKHVKATKHEQQSERCKDKVLKKCQTAEINEDVVRYLALRKSYDFARTGREIDNEIQETVKDDNIIKNKKVNKIGNQRNKKIKDSNATHLTRAMFNHLERNTDNVNKKQVTKSKNPKLSKTDEKKVVGNTLRKYNNSSVAFTKTKSSNTTEDLNKAIICKLKQSKHYSKPAETRRTSYQIS